MIKYLLMLVFAFASPPLLAVDDTVGFDPPAVMIDITETDETLPVALPDVPVSDYPVIAAHVWSDSVYLRRTSVESAAREVEPATTTIVN